MSKEAPIMVGRRTALRWAGGLVGSLALKSAESPLRRVRAEGPVVDFIPLDFDLPRGPGIPEGHAWRVEGEKVFLVTDEAAPMWSVYKQYGGADKWGVPISGRWTDPLGRINQAFEKGIFQYKDGEVSWANILDDLSDRDLDNNTDLVPPIFSWDSDSNKTFGHTTEGPLPWSIEENHINVVFNHPSIRQQFLAPIKDFYLSNVDWFEQWGLPMSCKDYGPVAVVRCQRSALQLWKEKTPWTSRPMQVVPINGGSDFAQKYGLIPAEALEPIDNPYGRGGPTETTPLPFPERFGDLEKDGVEFVNRGKKVGLAMGDETLYRNLLWWRNNYAQFPEVKRRFIFYEDIDQLRNLSQIPYDWLNTTFSVDYHGLPFRYAEVRWAPQPDGILEFHITLPAVSENKIASPEDYLKASTALTGEVYSNLFSSPEGRSLPDKYGVNGIIRGSQKAKDFDEYPTVISPYGNILATAVKVVIG